MVSRTRLSNSLDSSKRLRVGTTRSVIARLIRDDYYFAEEISLSATDAADLMKQLAWLKVEIGNATIPRVLLGTSPFVGSGQFGTRSPIYYAKFYRNPENWQY